MVGSRRAAYRIGGWGNITGNRMRRCNWRWKKAPAIIDFGGPEDLIQGRRRVRLTARALAEEIPFDKAARHMAGLDESIAAQ